MKHRKIIMTIITVMLVFLSLIFFTINNKHKQEEAKIQSEKIYQVIYQDSDFNFISDQINETELKLQIEKLEDYAKINPSLQDRLDITKDKIVIMDQLQLALNVQEPILIQGAINPQLSLSESIDQGQLDSIQDQLKQMEDDSFSQTLLTYIDKFEDNHLLYTQLIHEIQALPVNNFNQETIDSYVEINSDIENLSSQGFRGHLVENFNHKSQNFANNLKINSQNLSSLDIDISKLLSIDIFDHRLTGSSLDYRPLIALTFDDGPSQTTLEILDVLDKYGIQATFFQLGMNVEQYPEIAKEVVNRGHLVGNHSYSHVNFNLISYQEIQVETDTTQNLISHATGITPEFFRTPYGTNRQAMIELYPAMVPVYWNVDSQDWTSRDPQATYDMIMGTLQHRSIVLMHDIFPFNVEVLEQLIPQLLEQGYIFTTPDRIPEADNYNL